MINYRPAASCAQTRSIHSSIHGVTGIAILTMQRNTAENVSLVFLETSFITEFWFIERISSLNLH